MVEGRSLLQDAKRLTAKARVKRDNAARVQADGQFSTALSKLTSQVDELGTQLRHYSQLVEAGIPVGPVPDLARAPEKLRIQIADVGRPTPQFLNSRSTDLAKTIKALRTLCDDAWRAWAAAKRASLTLDPDLVHGNRGQEVSPILDKISQESTKPFHEANISLFEIWVGQAEYLIDQLRSPMTPDDVITRLKTSRGSLTFADLTHEEIDALRSSPEHARRVRLNVR